MKALLVLGCFVGTARAQVVGTGFIANDVAGDVQSGRIGIGISAAYFPIPRLGAELDGELHGHFFRDEDVARDQPAGVDLNTSAALATGNVVVPYCLFRLDLGSWCPYATAGAGAIHATFDGRAVMPGATSVELAQTNFLIGGGVGVIHQLTQWIGVRVDARYFRAFVDETAHSGGYFTDYGWLRISVGVTIGFPK